MGVKCDMYLHPTKDGIYRCGDHIKGIISYTIDKVTRFQTISVCFQGKATTSFRVGSGDNRKTVYGNQDIWEDAVIVTNGVGEDLRTYVPGIYKAEFSFRVPHSIPSTYEDCYGSIHYKVKVVFKEPGLFDFGGKEFFKLITVKGYIIPSLTDHPITFGAEKSLVGLPFTSKKSVFIKATVNNTCLSPSEHMMIDYEVTNETKTELKVIEIHLVSTAEHKESGGYHTRQDTESEKLYFQDVYINPKCIAKGKINVQIPSDALSIQHCEVISKKYNIKIIVKLPFPRLNAELAIPIDVGEIFNEADPSMVDTISPNIDDSPPSYREAMEEKPKK